MSYGTTNFKIWSYEFQRWVYKKTEKTKKEIERLEFQMMVASQAIETTTTEIIKLRELELYPQLLDLVKGLVMLFLLLLFFHVIIVLRLPCALKC